MDSVYCKNKVIGLGIQILLKGLYIDWWSTGMAIEPLPVTIARRNHTAEPGIIQSRCCLFSNEDRKPEDQNTKPNMRQENV